jgi:ribosome-associated toxin RatA of RatAB toxin-antitoxin module
MAMHRRSREALVAAPSEVCFATLTDYERACDWQGPVKRADVLEWGDDGLGRVVAYEIDAKVRTVRYTLRHRYDAPRSVVSELVEGDVKHLEGEWRFEPREASVTLVTFSARLDPGLFVPGPVRRIIEGQVMGAALDDLRREAERVAAT